MDSEHPLTENRGMIPEQSGGESERLSFPSACAGVDWQEPPYVENLLMADWGDRRGKPLTVEELLIIGGKAFEPMFHQPPVGPIPEYLVSHLSVYGCVTEYEEKLEELDRWKVLQLSRWLKDRLGRSWSVAGRIYELQAEKEETAASEKFWFRLIEDRTRCGELISDNRRYGGSVGSS